MSTFTVDFTDVEDNGGGRPLEAGEHIVKIESATGKAFSTGSKGLVIKFVSKDGGSVYENFPLVDTALWKFKRLLSAIGLKNDGKVKIDTSKIEGKRLMIRVGEEEYNGKMKPRLEDMYPYEGKSDPAPKKKGKKQPDPEPDEDEFEDEFEDDDDDDEDLPF